MLRAKRKAWLVTIASAALFLAAAWPMAQRISAFNRLRAFHHYHVEPVQARELRTSGFPPLKLEDSTDPSRGTGDDAFALKLTYGEPDAPGAAVRYIPVRKPVAMNLPGLGIYEEWLRVLAINEVEREPGDSAGRAQRPKKGTERLIIAVRRTPEGFDPNTWGLVRRTEWLFDFYDLRPDGTIVASTYRWPMAKDYYEQEFQRRAAAPDADERLKALAAIPPLQERSIEYFAALHVIPKLNMPKYKFTDTDFGPHVMGWTLPVCMLSGLVFSFAFFFAVAPARKPAVPTP